MTEKLTISRRFHFSASHRYWVKDWSEEQNLREFGKTTSPHGHGHNYILEVTLSGAVDPVTGMIVNLTQVKHWVNKVLEGYDHRYLNLDHPAFASLIPSTENIALVLWSEISPLIPKPIKMSRIRLWEQEDLFAEVVADE